MASSTTLYPVVNSVTGTYLVAGSFKPNGSSAVDNTVNNPTGIFTVTRTGTGVFTITLAQKPNRILFCDVKYRGSTASMITPVINSYVDSTGVITITALDIDDAAAQVDTAGDELITAGADTNFDALGPAAADNAGDRLVLAGAAFTAAADITAASGTRVEFFAICEDSNITTRSI